MPKYKDPDPKFQILDTKEDSNTSQMSRDDPEESLIGTFMQWVNSGEQKQRKMETQSDSKLDKGKKPSFINRGHSDTSERPTKSQEFKPQFLGGFTTSSLLKNVHISRPATPQPVNTPSSSCSRGSDNDAQFDKYRVMYLIVLVDQQQEHLRHVIANMRCQGAEKSRVNQIIKVKEAMSMLNAQLLSIRDNDAIAMQLIGPGVELDDFFIDVENICSLVDEISLDGCEADAVLPKMLLFGSLEKRGELKDGKVKIRRKKKSPTAPPDVTRVFQNKKQTPERHSTPIPLKYTNTREGLQLYRQKAKASNKSASCQKQKELYNQTKMEQGKGIYPCNSTSDDWSDTDMEEELTHSYQSKWPVLNTTDEARIRKEKQLHSLMHEIDGLLADVGLTDGMKRNKNLSYEVVMMGGGEKRFPRNGATDVEKVSNKTNNQSQKGKKTQKSKKQSDQFIEELDKLLEECD